MVDVIFHDPELARKCYEAAKPTMSGKRSDAAYHKWLKNYVYPLARAIGVIYVSRNKVILPDGRQVDRKDIKRNSWHG